jgi:hypothetical protein
MRSSDFWDYTDFSSNFTDFFLGTLLKVKLKAAALCDSPLESGGGGVFLGYFSSNARCPKKAGPVRFPS